MTGSTRWRALVAAGAVTVASALAACSGGGLPAPTASPASPARTTARPSLSASASGSPAGGTASPAGQPAAPGAACVTRVLDKLSLAQRVGQLFLVAVDGDTAGSALTRAERAYHFGSLLLNKSAAGTEALAGPTAAMQALAPAATGGVGFFIAANQEGGSVQQLTGPGFAAMPSALTQGGWSTARLRTSATSWATELRAAGVNLDLAPVMDVVPAAAAAGNAPIGALMREFGADPAANGAHGAAFITGMAAAGVATVAKHFPGLGRVAGNTDFTASVTDDATTAGDPYLNSFRGAVSAGVPMVMVALATYTRIDPARPAVFSPAVIRLLRGQLGFTGVIVSDDLADAAAVQSVPAADRGVRFLAAGGDLVTAQSLAPAEQMAAAVLATASDSAAFRATVNAAAGLVLAAKQTAGLVRC